MCVQPSFIIGTNNDDGSANFAPITWVSATCEGNNDYLLVISMFGSKTTKTNVLRTGIFSANLVSRDMLKLMDYFGSRHAKDGNKFESSDELSNECIGETHTDASIRYSVYSYHTGHKNDIPFDVVRGEVLDVPVLDASRWVYECEVAKTVETGESTTFFCHIRNIQIDARLNPEDTFDVDLTTLDPVIYSGRYYSLGESLGKIGDFL